MSAHRILIPLVAIALAASASIAAAETTATTAQATDPRIIEVRRIWDAAPHNAFTDLVRFNGKFYCTFRESSAHVPKVRSDDGKARVIASDDGEKWESVALLAMDGIDLRDPKLSITPDGRLMVTIHGAYYDNGKVLKRTALVSFWKPGEEAFSTPVEATLDPAFATSQDWLWRVTWHDGIAYGVAYQGRSESGKRLHLVRSKDGRTYELVKSFDMDGAPNESVVRFMPDGEMLIVARREEADKNGKLGRSKPPYQEWEWRDINLRIGGPDLLRLADGSLVLGTRKWEPKPKMTVGTLSLDGQYSDIVELPSGGDTSYPGMLVHDNQLWVSYYSSHEGKTAIYLAKLKLPLRSEPLALKQ